MSETLFYLTKQHVELLSSAVVRWEDCEYGAPAIDCKRPYGNTSVVKDISEILDIPEDKDVARKLHLETETALQIILQTRDFLPGVYKRETWGWTRVNVPSNEELIEMWLKQQ